MEELKYKLVLASTSPRRQFLMREAGFKFRIEKPESDESFPDHMPVEMVPRYLAEKKAESFKPKLSEDEIVMTADTVVIIDGKILNKPANYDDAVRMLTQLSGRTHKVLTAVCLMAKDKQELFQDITKVTFKTLTPGEIDYYIKTCKPFDKAGSYGAQDWVGMVGIEKINGSYFTVMGLPMHKVYKYLMGF